MKQRGFSIVELMVVLVVLAVTLTLAAPSFIDTRKNSQIRTESYAFRSTLTNARSEAMARRFPVIVCESADNTNCTTSGDWSNGYLAFADMDEDDAPDPNEIIINHRVSAPEIELAFEDFSGTGQSRVSFSTRGEARGSSGTMIICDDRGAKRGSAVILRGSGQVSMATDTDGSEIVDTLDNNGLVKDIVCN
ncbi:GspH/FimT family pseudopilin [Mangrovimicrobium sediminis]|uniref:GspH/FimT family pseudopilin n=1 Tax=Mangrovimicrobium sediminis TaxID=2562682 RepID=UPI001436713A|nr:GspH/FimT family pseudopilin [Haliea sp. SAOS-164]